jgi:predicted TIM-barrel fold metal-dependent hydrolase
VIDPHHHLWDPPRTRHRWLLDAGAGSFAGDLSQLQKPYLVEDYLADLGGRGLERSVHVQAEWDHEDDPVAETRWLQSLADEHGFPHGIVAYADLSRPDAGEVLAEHARHANVRGIRQIVNWHADPSKTYVDRPDLLTDPDWRRGYAELVRNGLSFDLQCYPPQLADAADLARAFPDTQVVLDHTGMPIDGHEQWAPGMAALARCENVSVKLSGLVMIDHVWTVDSLRPYVREAIELFGPGRCMFASNFPVDKLHAGADALYDAYEAIVADLSPAERRALFHDNAARIYRV